MIGLDRLMKIKGVLAAGQFSEDGKVLRAVGDIPENLMDFTARMCAKQSKSFETAMDQFSQVSKMEWWPLTGWAAWGGKYAILVMDNTGVFVDPKYVDFNQLAVDLMGSEATGPRPMNY